MNLNRNYIYYINLFFIFLFFPSFVTGIFLPNLIFGVFVFSHLVLNFHSLKKIIYKNKIFTIFFTTFYFYLLVSSFFSNHIYFSLESSFLYFCYLIYSIAIISIMDKNRNIQKYFLFLA